MSLYKVNNKIIDVNKITYISDILVDIKIEDLKVYNYYYFELVVDSQCIRLIESEIKSDVESLYNIFIEFINKRRGNIYTIQEALKGYNEQYKNDWEFIDPESQCYKHI